VTLFLLFANKVSHTKKVLPEPIHSTAPPSIFEDTTSDYDFCPNESGREMYTLHMDRWLSDF
jgi:hypothetical protein